MAITKTALNGGGATQGGAGNAHDQSVTLTTGRICTVRVSYLNGSGAPGTNSIADTGGNTWTKQIEYSSSASGNQTGASIFTATITTGGLQTITVTNSNGGDIDFATSIDDWQGVSSITGTISGRGDVNPPNNYTQTLSATPASADYTISALAAREFSAMSGTAFTGWTVDYTGQQAAGVPTMFFQHQYRTGSTSTTVTHDLVGGDEYEEVAVSLILVASTGITRTYQYAEALSQVTMTSSTYASKCSMTITSANLASSTWVIFAQGVHKQTTNTTTSSAVRLRNDTAGTTLADASNETSSSGSSLYTFSFIVPVTFGASPGDQTFRVEQASPSNTSTVFIERIRMFAIKLTGNDTVQSLAGPWTPSSTTDLFDTKVTWTFPATGTFDIFTSIRFTGTATNCIPGIRLLGTDGSTELRTVGFTAGSQRADATDVLSICFHTRVTGTSGQTLLFQTTKRGGTNTLFDFRNAYVIGFDTAGFEGSWNVEDQTSVLEQNVVTNPVPWNVREESQLSIVPPGVADYWAFSNFMQTWETESGTINQRAKVVISGTDLAEHSGPSAPSSGWGGWVVGRFFDDLNSQYIGIEPLYQTGSGPTFPVDNRGGSAVVWQLTPTTGATTPPTPSARPTKYRRRERPWTSGLGLRN